MKYKKQTIILKAFGGSNWIGGLYYIKNIAFQLSQNEGVLRSYNIIVYTSEKNYPIFSSLPANITIATAKRGIIGKINKFFFFMKHRTQYVYPASNKELKIANFNRVGWIADFQHKHYPDFFSTAEINDRDRRFELVANEEYPLVLSSQDALRDFKEFYSNSRKNVYVIPFVSYIENEIMTIKGREEDILKKFSLVKGKYVIISNQFWQHKNHIIVFKAIEILIKEKLNKNITFVFTGKPEDYRNHEYYQALMKYIDDPSISDCINVLGFIDRIDQLALMKNSNFIIQPSLFEGWGTVVEDAKVLDKTILLSDIPVHHEQMNEKCVLFDPRDPRKLAELIDIESRKEHVDDIKAGIESMYKRAKEYSSGFEQLLKDTERNKGN